MKLKLNTDLIAKALLVYALVLSGFVYGYAVREYGIFPSAHIRNAMASFQGLVPDLHTLLYTETAFTRSLPTHIPERTSPGLNLVTEIDAEETIAARIMDMEGRVVHAWNVDWFDIWPDSSHILEELTPKSQPGTHIHGAVVLEDGDLVYNYDNLGLVRLDMCGDVVWRLPYLTHHSIHLDDDGVMWVSGLIRHLEMDDRFPNHGPRFVEPTLLAVSQDGQILEEISVLTALRENDLNGLLYMSTKDNRDTRVRADTLHLNDVEPFPGAMTPGMFGPGDLLVSLRNIHTVLVLNKDSGKINHVWTGPFVRQHDPDFIDGDTISVLDNNNIGPEQIGHQSRILIFAKDSSGARVYYEGNAERAFYTDIMGKHQWLPNGNLLITEAMKGRAFEIDPAGEIVWEYVNLVGDGTAGLLEEVQRLAPAFDEVFSPSRISAECKADDRS